jgi:hypothetical protein
VHEEVDDVVEVAGDYAVVEVPEAVAAQAGVRGERLVYSARPCKMFIHDITIRPVIVVY